MLNAKALKKGLEQFTGTTRYFYHSFGLQYTDGIHYLSKKAKCDWLINVIALHQPQLIENPMLEAFQLWILTVGNGHEFIKPQGAMVLTCWEDEPKAGDTPIICQEFELTNFPLPEVRLYVQKSLLMLPSEY